MARTFTRNPLSAVLTDKDGYTLDSTTPVPVNPAESGTANYNTNQVAITGVVAQIAAANATRRAILIKNTHATNLLFVGSAAVTVLNGHQVSPGESVVLPIVGAISGIGSGSLTATYFEVYD